jgi:ubiquinone/menaquinone biosynthesis C-methylase UbiE
MSTSDSPAERYLRDWHVRHPDASRVFVDARDATGKTSYERLALLAAKSTFVVDLACGTGTLLSLIRDAAPSASLTGIDLSESELRLAVARVPTARFSAARAQALPLATGSMDVVVCHMALMLMDRLDDVLSEFRRVLRSGGCFSAVLSRPAPPDDVTRAILKSLRPLWEGSDASLRPPTLGDSRTLDVEALESLVKANFDRASFEAFDVVRRVSRDDLWPFLVDSLYGLDAIPESTAREILDGIGLPDPVPWTIPMVQVQGTA